MLVMSRRSRTDIAKQVRPMRPTPFAGNRTRVAETLASAGAARLLAQSELTPENARLLFRKRVHGTYGLMVKGSDAIPYLLKLLQNSNPDAREDASFLLGELEKRDDIAELLVEHMKEEADVVARSAMIDALGKLRYEPAIPALAHVILSETIDDDTRSDAADSLAKIVGEGFSSPGDRIGAATKWLAERGYSKEKKEPDRSPT